MNLGVIFHDHILTDFTSESAKELMDYILNFLSENPEVDIIIIPAGVPVKSGDLFRNFIDKISQPLKDRYPKKLISIMVTENKIPLPVDILSHENILLSFEPDSRCYRHSLGDEECEINLKIKPYLEKQSEIWQDIHIFEHYMGTYDQNSLPFPILHTINSDLMYFDSLEVLDGVISQCEPGNWGTYGLNYYIFSRMAWNSGDDLGGIVDDYCDRYYNLASVPMKRYFAKLEDARNSMEHFYYIEPPSVILTLLNEKLISELESELQNARELARDAMEFDRIRKVQLSLEHAKLIWYTLHYYYEAQRLQESGENDKARGIFQKSVDTGEKLVTFLFENLEEGVFIIPKSYIFDYIEPIIMDARDKKELLINE
jgi:hypothetical protein